MLHWTLDAAAQSALFSRIVLSTDDEEIAHAAGAAGAEVVMRDPALATDASTLAEVLREFVQAQRVGAFEVCMLLANCPLRSSQDIRSGYDAFVARQAPAMLSVTSFLWTPPFRALGMRDGAIHGYFGDWVEKKSQEYPAVVCPSGAVYWTHSTTAALAHDLYVPGIQGFDMPWYRGIDIDTAEDFAVAACIRHALDHGFDFEI